MRLEQEPHPDLEQITLPADQLPDGFNPSADDDRNVFHLAFALGGAQFQNPLHTLIAQSKGIDPHGNLDMEMLSAAQKTAEYLVGRQGQPVVIVEKSTSDGITLYQGHIGTLDGEPILGFHPSEHGSDGNPGIGASGNFHSFNCYIRGRHESLGTQWLNDRTGPIPLSTQEIVLGKPQYNKGRAEFDNVTQEIVAGSDIIDWLKTEFNESDGYHFFMNIVWSLTEQDQPAESFNHLLQEPFVSILHEERVALESVRKVIEGYKKRKDLLQKALIGAQAQASLDIDEIAHTHPKLKGRFPQTWTSNQISVVGNLDNAYGEQLDERIAAIDRRLKPVNKALIRPR
jgi:hypothetical protein